MYASLLPLYISYITGKKCSRSQENQSLHFLEKNGFFYILWYFLLGVSVVYISLGLGMSFKENAFSQFYDWFISSLLQRLSGLLITFSGSF